MLALTVLAIHVVSVMATSSQSSRFSILGGLGSSDVPFVTVATRSRIMCAAECSSIPDCFEARVTEADPGGVLVNCEMYKLNPGMHVGTNNSIIITKGALHSTAAEAGLSCTTSGTRSLSDCAFVYDGNTQPNSDISEWAAEYISTGYWIRIDFPGAKKLYTAGIWFRCYYDEQASRLQFTLSDGTSTTADRTCNGSGSYLDCAGQSRELFSLPQDTTTSLTVTALEDCTPNTMDYPGYREIQVWAIGV